MKHNFQITLILIAMFLLTQFIGLFVISTYMPKQKTVVNETTGELVNMTISKKIPYGLQPPTGIKPFDALTSIIIAMVIAIALIIILSKIKAALFIKIWFFAVVTIAMSLTLNSILNKLTITSYSAIIALLAALPLAFFKIFKRHMLVHNLTELMIYPGIAAIFVPILNIWTVVALLVLISAYDMWAVWHTGFMQKMAKFQIQKLKIFAGFFVPYITKKQRQLIKKERAKMKKLKEKGKKGKAKMKGKKIQISLAILGGGDVVFPIITAGVVLYALGIIQALIVTLCATIALSMLFFFAQKRKFYPAMPFISAGCFVGLLIAYLV